MSWIVESLLLDRYKIKEEADFDSDEYNNILIIERKIKELVESKVIDRFELAVLDFVSSNQSYSELEKLLGINRNTLALYFKKICERISYALGGEFTDEGYLEYMRINYHLNEQQLNVLREHISGKYRHTIRRK